MLYFIHDIDNGGKSKVVLLTIKIEFYWRDLKLSNFYVCLVRCFYSNKIQSFGENPVFGVSLLGKNLNS